MKTAIIIPARMASQRFPNKPMAKINGTPMIERVWRQGINSKVGDVYVACSEDEVFNLIISKGGKAIMTDPNYHLALIGSLQHSTYLKIKMIMKVLLIFKGICL